MTSRSGALLLAGFAGPARYPLPAAAVPLPPLDWQQHNGVWRAAIALSGKPQHGETPHGQILPSFSPKRPVGAWRFALSYRSADVAQGYKSLAAIGGQAGPFDPDSDDAAVESAIDVFMLKSPLQAAVLYLHLDAPAPPDDYLATVSFSDGRPALAAANQGRHHIAVPAKSQMLLDKSIANHVCSPTCVAMLIEYFGGRAAPEAVAAAARHRDTGLYGVWPANIHAAGAWGLQGYLMHFAKWEAARALLDRGQPLIASIRFEEGQLPGAPIRRTAGHLVVLCGYDGDYALVNDPAAPDEASVPRRYPLEPFLRAWLGGSGVGYVLFGATA